MFDVFFFLLLKNKKMQKKDDGFLHLDDQIDFNETENDKDEKASTILVDLLMSELQVFGFSEKQALSTHPKYKRRIMNDIINVLEALEIVKKEKRKIFLNSEVRTNPAILVRELENEVITLQNKIQIKKSLKIGFIDGDMNL